MQAKTKLKAMQAGGALTVFAPLAIGVGINFNDYISTSSSAFSLTMGGALAAFVVVLQMLGKGKKVFGSAFVASGIAFAILILLEPLILNLKFLTGLVFVGEAGYTVVFKSAIERLKKSVDYTEQANLMKEAFSNKLPNGRI